MEKNKKTISKRMFECGNCNDGVIDMAVIEIARSKKGYSDISMMIKKCPTCKHQYGLKGLMALKELCPAKDTNSLVS